MIETVVISQGLRFLGKLIGSGWAKFSRRDKDKLILILRKVHFDKNGILKVLAALSKREKMDPAEYAAIVREFKAKQLDIQGDLYELATSLKSVSDDLPLQSVDALDGLSEDKQGLRSAVNELLASYNPEKPSRKYAKEARELVEGITELNNRINTVERDARM